MAAPKGDDSKKKRASGSEVVTTRVNVALPFSAIRVEAPSADLLALAAIVRELSEVVADVSPGPQARGLRDRARALETRLT